MAQKKPAKKPAKLHGFTWCGRFMKEAEARVLMPHIDVFDVDQQLLQYVHTVELYSGEEGVAKRDRVLPQQLPETNTYNGSQVRRYF